MYESRTRLNNFFWMKDSDFNNYFGTSLYNGQIFLQRVRNNVLSLAKTILDLHAAFVLQFFAQCLKCSVLKISRKELAWNNIFNNLHGVISFIARVLKNRHWQVRHFSDISFRYHVSCLNYIRTLSNSQQFYLKRFILLPSYAFQNF